MSTGPNPSSTQTLRRLKGSDMATKYTKPRRAMAVGDTIALTASPPPIRPWPPVTAADAAR